MKRKILIVDDDADVLELVQFSLTRAGFAIGTARNGVEALQKICTLHPDLVLLDLMMPQMDGFAVCELLRRDPATATIPIVVLTAATSQLTRLAGMEAGATMVLTKPFSPKGLVARIDELLRPGYAANSHRVRA